MYYSVSVYSYFVPLLCLLLFITLFTLICPFTLFTLMSRVGITCAVFCAMLCVAAEKFRPIRPGPHIKRTGSLDTVVVPYLKGEWPRTADFQAIPPHSTNDTCSYLDKATQVGDRMRWKTVLILPVLYVRIKQC